MRQEKRSVARKGVLAAYLTGSGAFPARRHQEGPSRRQHHAATGQHPRLAAALRRQFAAALCCRVLSSLVLQVGPVRRLGLTLAQVPRAALVRCSRSHPARCLLKAHHGGLHQHEIYHHDCAGVREGVHEVCRILEP